MELDISEREVLFKLLECDMVGQEIPLMLEHRGIIVSVPEDVETSKLRY